MTTVVDASVVVAALVDDGPDGRWSEAVLLGGGLLAPHLMPVEVANVLRRAVLARKLSAAVASLAHDDLLALTVGFVPYHALARRVWELRGNATCYDGWYVALAESLDAPLATLDRRLAATPTARCAFLTP